MARSLPPEPGRSVGWAARPVPPLGAARPLRRWRNCGPRIVGEPIWAGARAGAPLGGRPAASGRLAGSGGMTISERAGLPADPSILVDVPKLVRAYYDLPARSVRSRLSGSPSGRPAIAAPRSTPRSTRPTSSRRPRRSAATGRARASTGRCSSGATRTPCPSRRSARRSRSWPPTGSTSGSTPPTATRRRRSSRTRSSPTTAAARPPGRRDRGHAVAQPARGRRLQVQPAERRAGRHRRHRLDRRAGQRAPGHRGRHGPSESRSSGAPAPRPARLRWVVRRRPRRGHRHGGDPRRPACASASIRSAARASPTGRRSPSATAWT